MNFRKLKVTNTASKPLSSEGKSWAQPGDWPRVGWMTGWVAGWARGLVGRFWDGGVQGRVNEWMDGWGLVGECSYGVSMDDRLYLLWVSRAYENLPL